MAALSLLLDLLVCLPSNNWRAGIVCCSYFSVAWDGVRGGELTRGGEVWGRAVSEQPRSMVFLEVVHCPVPVSIALHPPGGILDDAPCGQIVPLFKVTMWVFVPIKNITAPFLLLSSLASLCVSPADYVTSLTARAGKELPHLCPLNWLLWRCSWEYTVFCYPIRTPMGREWRREVRSHTALSVSFFFY